MIGALDTALLADGPPAYAAPVPASADQHHLELRRILGRMLRADGSVPNLMDAIGRLKTGAYARGLTDAALDGELRAIAAELGQLTDRQD